MKQVVVDMKENNGSTNPIFRYLVPYMFRNKLITRKRSNYENLNSKDGLRALDVGEARPHVCSVNVVIGSIYT